MTHTVPDLGEINLDCFTPDELEALSDALNALRQFANLKAFAMRERAAGRINGANIAEAQLDVLYLEIPPNWRW